MVTNDIHIGACQDWMKTDVLFIANQELGVDYFKSVLKDLKSYTTSIYCIFEGQKLIGFNLSYQCSLGQFLKDTQSQLPINLLHTSQILIVKTMVIMAAYQRKGYGTRLLKHLIDETNCSEIVAMVAVGWKSSSSVNIEHLMNTFGFAELCELPEFWRADSIKHGYHCPACGQPCKCSAIIYSKLLLDSNS